MLTNFFCSWKKDILLFQILISELISEQYYFGDFFMRFKTCLIGFLLAAPAFSQDIINWNFNHQAAGLGNGCGPGEVSFITAGNEVSVVFSGLGIAFDADDAAGGITDRKNCRIVIPTKVRAGYYLAKLNQKLSYGYTRTDSTSGTVTAVSEFYGQAAGRITRNIPTPGMNAYAVPLAQAEVNSYWKVSPEWCLTRDYVGNFKANLTTAGKRADISKDLKISIDGHDIRFDAIGDAYLCE